MGMFNGYFCRIADYGFMRKMPQSEASPWNHRPRRVVPIQSNDGLLQVNSYELPQRLVDDTLHMLAEKYLNRIMQEKLFWVFSQTDGNVYCWAELVYDCLRQTAQEKNLESPLFIGRWQDGNARSLMMSFYDQLRERRLDAPELIGRDYYARTFYFTNYLPATPVTSRGFYVVIAANAFPLTFNSMEEMRMRDTVLGRINISRHAR